MAARSRTRSLAGKVAVVTGGARGIGAQTARALAAAGASVAIGDLDVVQAEQVAAEIDGLALRLDVTDRAGFTAFLDEVAERLGPVDILINNAGIMALSRIEDEDDAQTLRQLEINLHAVIRGTREAIRRMKPRGTGHIVNVASSAGKGGFPGAATYCATKHGVVGFSEAARGELRGTGIEVSCVLPAVVRTELAAGLSEARGVKSVEAADVADSIIATLRRPRFEVFVPRSVGAISKFAQVLPRPARELLVRAMRADRLLLDSIDSPERTDYEKRAAASAPALDEPPPLPGAG
ncbi:MAG TPA: SDR family oxidoreductase, partial [Pseudonocardiaceae bacterium]|nr:SDR family oxidoreductase [Pseudonocardiaceae bacterium]